MKMTSTKFALAFSLLGITATALAQTGTGTLQGDVLDPSGALVPQAQVTVTNASGFSRTLTSDGVGAFALSDLAPGDYSISINATGFTQTLENVEVESNKVTRDDVKLGISVLQEVDVTAQ